MINKDRAFSNIIAEFWFIEFHHLQANCAQLQGRSQ